MAIAKKTAEKTTMPKSMPADGRDPRGGLTDAGRRFYNERDGSNLKPGVKGSVDTLEKMRRKGSFLTRFFTNPRGPMMKNGKPTRLALSAHAWGEPVPETEVAAKYLAAEGRKLLEQYREAKKELAVKKAARKTSARKTAAKGSKSA